MSKSIKVADDVYNDLLSIQRVREPFSEIIRRLLRMTELLVKIEPMIRGQQAFLESRRAAKEAEHPVD